MFQTKLVVLAVVSVVVSFVGSVVAQTQIYFNDFESPVGSEWSNQTRSITPIGARRFLGLFPTAQITLALKDVPAHNNVKVSFDLFIIYSWDGNDTTVPYGPDEWMFRADGNILLRTTFSNIDGDFGLYFRQAYPDSFPRGSHPPYTGANEVNNLGYIFENMGEMNAVYQLNFEFEHSQNSIDLEFSAISREPFGIDYNILNESWGLDNMVVELIAENQPPQITHTPTTSAIQNQNIPVRFIAEDEENNLASIGLFYRKTGDPEYQSVGESSNRNGEYTLMIPSIFATIVGVNYYIEAKDAEGATKTTPVYHICITSQNQLKVFNHETQKYVNLPCDYDFNPGYNTVVFVHGWNLYCGKDLNGLGEWIPELGKAISEKLDKKVNILAWDWLKEAKARLTNCKCPDNDPYCEKCDVCITGIVNLADELWSHREEIPYAKIPDQAKKLSFELQKLLEKKVYSRDKSIQFIGHSLGAHVVAQCAESMAIASKSDPTKYFPSQVTCLDPATSDWFKSLRDICSPIGSVRINRPEVYTELYDGTANFSSRKFKLFVDVPYSESGTSGHDVHKWYIKTVSEFDVKIYDPTKLFFAPKFNQPREAALIPGSLGFSTSCLLDDEKIRPELSCFNRESMDYDYLWGSNSQEFTYQGCRSYDCLKVIAISDDKFDSSLMYNIVGEDNGSSFVDNKLELKTTPTGKIEWQFQFDSYFTDSDSFKFDQYWYQEPQAGGGGETTEPPYAELVVSITSGDKTFVVYESNTNSQPIGETATSAYVDMREFRGMPVTIAFAFTSTDTAISAVVQNITAYQWLGRNNQEPIAHAGDDIDVIAEKDGHVLIQLSSVGSNDPESVELQYQWSEIIDGDWLSFSNEANPMLSFSEGTHQIRLCVYDEYLAQACDEMMVVVLPYGVDFIRGDSNRDGIVDISDAINTLGFLFAGTEKVTCEDSADANDDGAVDISDAIATLSFLFLGGKEIPPPYPTIGKDTTQDVLGCKS